MKQLLSLFFVTIALTVSAENGSQLWLRYPSGHHSAHFSVVASDENSATIRLAIRELNTAWQAQAAGDTVTLTKNADNAHLILGSAKSKLVMKFIPNSELKSLGNDGFIIKTVKGQTVIAAHTDIGVLYGTFHYLRLVNSGNLPADNVTVREVPSYQLRMLNHWDNLDRTVERGYAGHSLWKWDHLPHTISPRYEAYARANASIGINATVVTNVNANPLILHTYYLQKVKALADIFRPYGIRLFLAVNFSSPAELGKLPTSDPLDKNVIKWWKNKVDEIYTLIPDFGGFLVKANSEGLPGPHDYGRTHAEGANMLADALKAYDGLVLWRAFVYDPTGEDRAKQAYSEFMPLDGQFKSNVIIQIKNGPIDFQPREPFSPLFGALKKTPAMIEFQITQEYLGFSNHLVFLAPLFKETLDNDTYTYGQGSTVAKVTDGTFGKASSPVYRLGKIPRVAVRSDGQKQRYGVVRGASYNRRMFLSRRASYF